MLRTRNGAQSARIPRYSASASDPKVQCACKLIIDINCTAHARKHSDCVGRASNSCLRAIVVEKM